MAELDGSLTQHSSPLAIQGHDAVTSALAGSMASGRMHHAWLLTGPRGIGKASLARLAAAWILSSSKGEVALFGQSPAFEISADDDGANQVLNGAHPDFLSIAPALEDNKSGQIKIDQIRAMVPFMAHKPARGGWRVAVINSMDEVNRNGANAMLKLLEEPPENTIIFLVSSRPGQLPPTIRSRCRVVRMMPLSFALCRDVLGNIWADADPSLIDVVAQLCGGAPGRAIDLAESGAADCYQVACALMAAPDMDVPALAALTAKWGKGSAAGRLSRDGAVFCLERLLHFAAISATNGVDLSPCHFEQPAIEALCQRHSAKTLADMHTSFVIDSASAERLYLDFAQFLLRQLMKLHQKTLP